MTINTFSDSVTAPKFTQAQLDALYPPRAGATLWKLSRAGRVAFSPHEMLGPQYAADGTLLAASQTVYMPADFPSGYAAGLVVAGP